MKKNSRNIPIVALLAAILIINIAYYNSSSTIALTKSLVLQIQTINLVLIICFFLIKSVEKNIKKQFLRISYLFLLGFVIVHCQMYIDWYLGNYANFRQDYFINISIVPKAMVLSSIALNAFCLGYAFKTIRNHNITKAKKLNKILPKKFSLVLILLFFVLFLATANRQYFSGKYGSVELGYISTFSQTFLLYCFGAYIIVLAYNIKSQRQDLTFYKYLKIYNKWFYVILFTYLALVLVSGDRGPIIQLGLLILSGYVISLNKKIPLRYFFAGIVGGAIFITTLGEIRSIQSADSFSDRLNLSREKKELFSSGNSFSPNTFELAGSVRTLHAAVDYSETAAPNYGLFQMNQLIAIVPGLGTLIRSQFGLKAQDLISADFLTYYILGEFADHGVGTSCVADVYLDFRMGGVVVIFILFGMFVRHLERESFSEIVPKLIIWVFLFVFLYKAIYIGRSSITVIFRECLMIYFIIQLNLLITPIKKL